MEYGECMFIIDLFYNEKTASKFPKNDGSNHQIDGLEKLCRRNYTAKTICHGQNNFDHFFKHSQQCAHFDQLSFREQGLHVC